MEDLSKLKPDISEEEKRELEKFVSEICDMGYEEFEKIKPQLKGYGRKIMRFFTLPKTELHTRYMKMISEPGKKIKEKQEEERLIVKLNRNKVEFINEHNIPDMYTKSVKYHIIKHSILKARYSFETDDEVLQVSIPYFSPKQQMDKFGYSEMIYKSRTPDLFNTVVNNYPRYTGNADLTSNTR